MPRLVRDGQSVDVDPTDGNLIAYYRGEGYELVDDASAAVTFPRVFRDGAYVDEGPQQVESQVSEGTGEEMVGVEGLVLEDSWSPEISNEPQSAAPEDGSQPS